MNASCSPGHAIVSPDSALLHVWRIKQRSLASSSVGQCLEMASVIQTEVIRPAGFLRAILHCVLTTMVTLVPL